jgi:hypothetical protein
MGGFGVDWARPLDWSSLLLAQIKCSLDRSQYLKRIARERPGFYRRTIRQYQNDCKISIALTHDNQSKLRHLQLRQRDRACVRAGYESDIVARDRQISQLRIAVSEIEHSTEQSKGEKRNELIPRVGVESESKKRKNHRSDEQVVAGQLRRDCAWQWNRTKMLHDLSEYNIHQLPKPFDLTLNRKCVRACGVDYVKALKNWPKPETYNLGPAQLSIAPKVRYTVLIDNNCVTFPDQENTDAVDTGHGQKRTAKQRHRVLLRLLKRSRP